MSSEFSDWSKKRQNLSEEFEKLLNTIDSSYFKEKILWRQIFMNAIEDRNNALMMFGDLYPYVADDDSNKDRHVNYGDKLSMYLTRAEKSNEQLLKLSAQIRNALESQDSVEIDEDGIYDEIAESEDVS